MPDVIDNAAANVSCITTCVIFAPDKKPPALASLMYETIEFNS